MAQPVELKCPLVLGELPAKPWSPDDGGAPWPPDDGGAPMPAQLKPPVRPLTGANAVKLDRPTESR